MTVLTTADFLKSSFVEYPAEGTPERIVVCQMPESTEEVVAKKSGSSKVCVIAVISGLIVIALAAAAVVGLYLLLDKAQTVQYHLEVTMNDKSSLKQETTHYVTDDVVQQHIASDNGSDIWILSDFSRNIQIMRIQSDDSSSLAHCYVTPLNRTSAVSMPPTSADINATELITGPVMSPTTMPSVRYVPSPYPITDTSVLGSRGQELCSALSTFWAWPTYDASTIEVDASTKSVASTVSTLSRKRRQSPDVYSWCWVLQCQTMYIGSYYTTPRAFISCNRQYRCPCAIAVNDPASTVPPTTASTTTASAIQNDPIIAQYVFKKSSITV